MRATWLGHATVAVELDGTKLLTDPVLRARVGPLVRTAAPVDPAGYAGADAVLLSHMHGDHADAASLRALGPETRIIAPVGAARWLRARGLSNVDELPRGAWAAVGEVAVCAIPARHSRGRWPVGAGAGAVGFLIAGSQTCYFAGDTDLFAGMARLAGTIDLALLPVAGWGPTLGPGHLDPDRAARAAALIRPRVAVPIHHGTLRLPAQRFAPPEGAAERFAELTAAWAPATDVRLVPVGGSVTVPPAPHYAEAGA
jgi:L-ascorbate metabolism protein UlaG (beta-lactamase superfamily)